MPFPRRCLERLGEVVSCQATKHGWTSQLRHNVPRPMCVGDALGADTCHKPQCLRSSSITPA